MAKAIRTVTTIVRQVDEPAPGVKRLVLSDQDDWDLPPFRAGGFIDLHLKKGVVRTYSLCNRPGDNRRYVIAVKKEAAGRGGSKLLHDELQAGATIGVSIPRGGIRVAEDAMNVFVAGGIGVTPFISVIADMESRGQTNYVLHWASRGAPVLADMLQGPIAAGRVVMHDTTKARAPDIAAIIASHGNGACAYCCGPDRMREVFEAATASWPEARKHVERFVAPQLAADANAAPYQLVLSLSGREFTVLPEVGLLGTLEANDIDVPVSCAGGICGACRTRWTEGPPLHRDRVLSATEREHEVMVCVAGCAHAKLALDL
jgi:ferredoxin-NADP reductase